MSVERPTGGSGEPGHAAERLFTLTLRIALIACAATAAYLALALFDGPAMAGERPAQPRPLGGVIDVGAAVPRSLAGSKPSVGDPTGDARDVPHAPVAVSDPVRPPRLPFAPNLPTRATTAPARASTTDDARPPARATDGSGRGSGGRGTLGPARGSDGPGSSTRGSSGPGASSGAARWTAPKDAGPRPVVTGLTGGRTVEGTTRGSAAALPLAAAVTGPILVDAPGAVLDVLDGVVDAALGATEPLIPPIIISPLSPNNGTPPTPTQPVTVTPSAPGGSTPAAPIWTPPSPLAAYDSRSAGGTNSACCAAARPGSVAHGAVRAAPLSGQTHRHLAAPPLSGPAPFGDGFGGSGKATTSPRKGQLQALPAASPWRADSVLVSTRRLADAVRAGWSPAIHALPG